MGAATVIRNAAWVIAWDRAQARHVYLRDADVAFEGDTLTFVGRSFEGEARAEIDGRERLVMPGLVNIHSHPASEPLRKGITDEIRSYGFWHTSLYEYLTVFDTDEDGFSACLQVGLSELLLSGVTTVVDIWLAFDGWLDRLADSGIRACVAPMYREARWFTRDGHSVEYEWDAKAGREAFDRACHTIDLALQHPSGRLSGMLAPAQVDTCSAALIRDSIAYAGEKDLRLQIHAAQSVVEFHEMTRRHGLTPVQWLHDIGALGERTIIGHGVFLDHHPWLHWTTSRDLGLLADNGVTVAHCPTVFLRRGIALRTFGDYIRAGVNMGIGTDTYPHNYLEEMRSVATTARIIAETVDDLETSDVFNSATVGGGPRSRARRHRRHRSRLQGGPRARRPQASGDDAGARTVAQPHPCRRRTRGAGRLCRRQTGGRGRQGAHHRPPCRLRGAGGGAAARARGGARPRLGRPRRRYPGADGAAHRRENLEHEPTEIGRPADRPGGAHRHSIESSCILLTTL